MDNFGLKLVDMAREIMATPVENMTLDQRVARLEAVVPLVQAALGLSGIAIEGVIDVAVNA